MRPKSFSETKDLQGLDKKQFQKLFQWNHGVLHQTGILGHSSSHLLVTPNSGSWFRCCCAAAVSRARSSSCSLGHSQADCSFSLEKEPLNGSTKDLQVSVHVYVILCLYVYIWRKPRNLNRTGAVFCSICSSHQNCSRERQSDNIDRNTYHSTYISGYMLVKLWTRRHGAVGITVVLSINPKDLSTPRAVDFIGHQPYEKRQGTTENLQPFLPGIDEVYHLSIMINT